MKLPELQNSPKYVGLYVIDFGDHSAVGFTAEEVAELIDSEHFKDCKFYKIYRAYPDGKMELKGVPIGTFDLEMGMFFYAFDAEVAEKDYHKLISLATEAAPPSKAKVHLAKYSDDKFAVTLIYPAEYNEEFSSWLCAAEYKTAGPAEGGAEAVERYYRDRPEILQRHQLFAESQIPSRSGQELLAAVKLAVQR